MMNELIMIVIPIRNVPIKIKILYPIFLANITPKGFPILMAKNKKGNTNPSVLMLISFPSCYT